PWSPLGFRHHGQLFARYHVSGGPHVVVPTREALESAQVTQIRHKQLVAFDRFGGPCMRTYLMRFLVTALIISLVSAPHAMAEDEPPIDDLLADTAERLEETETMDFVLELEGTIFVDGAETIELSSAEGVMQRPNRVDVTFTAVVLDRQQISIRMINIGDDSWITDIVTGQWVPSPPEFGYNHSVLSDDEHDFGPL